MEGTRGNVAGRLRVRRGATGRGRWGSRASPMEGQTEREEAARQSPEQVRSGDGPEEWVDGYALRGRQTGARGSLDHSQSSFHRRPGRAQAQSPKQGGSRLGNPPPAAPPPSCVRGGGGGTGGAKARARQARGGAGPRSAGAKTPRARLVCSRRDLQGARGGGPRGTPVAAGAQVSASVPAPTPNAAEMHKVCRHQGHEQQAVKAQR